MIIYAQINEANIVIGVSVVNNTISDSRLIEIPVYDISYIGKKYEDGQFVDVPKPPESENWLIYTGPFRDRFDSVVGPGTKVSIMASTNPVIQAILTDMADRKWIDLDGRKAELQAALNIIKLTSIQNIVTGQPVTITDAHIDTILNTLPSDSEKYIGAL